MADRDPSFYDLASQIADLSLQVQQRARRIQDAEHLRERQRERSDLPLASNPGWQWARGPLWSTFREHLLQSRHKPQEIFLVAAWLYLITERDGAFESGDFGTTEIKVVLGAELARRRGLNTHRLSDNPGMRRAAGPKARFTLTAEGIEEAQRLLRSWFPLPSLG